MLGMLNPSVFMQDVGSYKATYSWTINPVGQLVEIDPRVATLQIINRFCSGFNIDPNGRFLTAGHCFTDGDVCSLTTSYDTAKYRVSFNYENGESFEWLYPIHSVLDTGPCTTTWGDTNSIDYAVLQLDESASQWGYLAPILNLPGIGCPVIAASHPDGQPKKLSLGQVIALQDELIDHTAATSPGSSGSPLSACVQGVENGAVKLVPAALGINTRGTVDARGQADHNHHYALSMMAIANRSPQVKQVSYLLSQYGCFQRAVDNAPKMVPQYDIDVNSTISYGKGVGF